ncbi:NfeD family protein [Shewanella marisflavi]|uniref:NfeD family protein n=1 Tax=Shewanella marisflavi TaxID=260364 RepID=UPI003AAFD386
MRVCVGRIIRLITLFLLIVLSLGQAMPETNTNASTVSSEPQVKAVPLMRFSGAIGPAIAEYLGSEIQHANELLVAERPPLLIIELDTPGGLVSSLRSINQAILSSKVPIACLVAPSGARAMSAGTYMLYACHIAAMAPATTLGAATPVQMGMPSQNEKPSNTRDKDPAKGDDNKQQGSNDNAMTQKIRNDAIAYIRSLANLRGRNVEFAEQAVSDAATLTATEALEQNVITLMASDAGELLTKLDGMEIVLDGEPHTFNLKQTRLVPHEQSWRSHFIATITDPNIAYILMLIGIYGLLLEFYSPGVGIAGVIGGISLLVALYAFQLLPINYVGLGLILLGIALIIAESMVPSFGILGLGGIVAFALGSLFLIDADGGDLAISLPLIAAVTVTAAGFSLWVLSSLWKTRKAANVSGDDLIIGAMATVVSGFEHYGLVRLNGECWQARCDTHTQTGQTVIVQGRERLTLIVAPIPSPTEANPPQDSGGR